MMEEFSEHNFRYRVDKALERVRVILDNTRLPQYPADVHHDYEDKYMLADFLTNSAIAAQFNVLSYLGIGEKDFAQLKEWANTRSVTLRLQTEERCKFLREEVRKVESDTKNVTKAGILGMFTSFTETRVTEFVWEYSVKWELQAFQGVHSDTPICLQSRIGIVEIKTSNKITPNPEVKMNSPLDVNITWLLQNIDGTMRPKFGIDRKSKECRTPRRNEEIEGALNFFKRFHSWASDVCNYFTYTVFPNEANHGLDLSAIHEKTIFVPVLPLFEDAPSKIPTAFMNSFLKEQLRSIDERRATVRKIFESGNKLITTQETQLVVFLQHANQIGEAYSEAIDYIEDMLYKQLIAALGKEITPVDFANYLTFHNRKIYAQRFRPVPFSYAIRRPDHTPEGTLSISVNLSDGSISSPVPTIVSHSVATRPMFFPINEATKISFLGDRYLHGYVSHQFAGQSGSSLSLKALARQFSSFILLVGRIASSTEFIPKHAIIIQNKDELILPLLLETLPTPKEFKDAIASLSPEQQRFCKAFRAMQLESTLFGICVIQIKPQLEEVLNLPDDCLTKEIQLSQDLLNLFIKYQIPTDLVSYDGEEERSVEEKVNRVRQHVANMNAMLDASKKTQLQEVQQEQQMRVAEQYIPPPRRVLAQDAAARNRVSVDAEEVNSVMARNINTLLERGERMESIQAASSVQLSSAGGGILHRLGYRGQPTKATNAPLTAARPRLSALPLPSLAAPPPPSPAPISSTPSPQNEIPAPSKSPQAPSNPKQQVRIQPDESGETRGEEAVIDYTKVPTELEAKFDKFDENNALRPTVINPGQIWSLTYQKSLLSQPATKSLETEDQEKDRNKAFDLLDALTKSGMLCVRHASLHVIIASTHCFDKSIIRTVVEDNINPIEKLENSSLIVASTIHQTPVIDLIAPDHRDRIATTSRRLIVGLDAEEKDENENLINM